MKYYRDGNNKVHGIDPADTADLAAAQAANWTDITENWPLAIPNLALLQQINALEQQQTPRLHREAVLGSTNVNPATGRTAAQQLAYLDAQIATLRAQLAGG